MRDSEWEQLKESASEFEDGERSWVVGREGRWVNTRGGSTDSLLNACTYSEEQARQAVAQIKENGSENWRAMKLEEAFKTSWQDNLSDNQKRSVAFRMSQR